MQDRMGDPFRRKKNQREDRERDLESLGIKLLRGNRFLPPLRGWFVAQFADFPDDEKIEQRSDQRDQHHRNADGVLMKSARGVVNSGGGRQRAKSDGNPDSADCDHCSAGALQNRKNNP